MLNYYLNGNLQRINEVISKGKKCLHQKDI